MVGGCQKKEPGAGMDSSLGLVKVYKDGYFHLRCMMDKMEQAADYHDELQREHKYNVHTNVLIVRYTDRVDVEKQQSMTPSICFEFCRTVPDMLHFGLVNGRDCYCAPYYMQGPGDGVCDAGCEGDSSVTCGNTNGMSDIYEMHSCNDVIEDAKAAYEAATDVASDAYDMVDYGNDVLDGSKAARRHRRQGVARGNDGVLDFHQQGGDDPFRHDRRVRDAYGRRRLQGCCCPGGHLGLRRARADRRSEGCDEDVRAGHEGADEGHQGHYRVARVRRDSGRG